MGVKRLLKQHQCNFVTIVRHSSTKGSQNSYVYIFVQWTHVLACARAEKNGRLTPSRILIKSMCICRLLTVPGKIYTPHGTVRRHPYMPLDQFVDEGVSDRETQPNNNL